MKKKNFMLHFMMPVTSLELVRSLPAGHKVFQSIPSFTGLIFTVLKTSRHLGIDVSVFKNQDLMRSSLTRC